MTARRGTTAEAVALVERAFAAAGPPQVVGATDAAEGRGIFSRVIRLDLRWDDGAAGPSSVVAKLPADGTNGAAAAASGAYHREALAYRALLSGSPAAHPSAHLVEEETIDGAIRCRLVLEDLGHHRRVDQLDGLTLDDALAVVDELRAFHQHWTGNGDLADLDVRRSTPSLLPPDALAAGVEALRTRWSGVVTPSTCVSFERLVANRDRLIAAFDGGGPATLCHGDPRADNLVFDGAGRPVLFDWQQLAVQAGVADIAWLAATSLDPDVRRAGDRRLADAYGVDIDRYRAGFVLPGFAVLLLAQRHIDDERTARFVATSITRICAAIDDLDVADMGS